MNTPLRFSETRFIQLNGTQVRLLAADDNEARLALKELRHKKREIVHLKRRLRRRLKAVKQREKMLARTGTTPELSPFAFVTRSLGAVVELATGWNPVPPPHKLPRTRQALLQNLDTLEEIHLNVTEARLHIEGKLVAA